MGVIGAGGRIAAALAASSVVTLAQARDSDFYVQHQWQNCPYVSHLRERSGTLFVEAYIGTRPGGGSLSLACARRDNRARARLFCGTTAIGTSGTTTPAVAYAWGTRRGLGCYAQTRFAPSASGPWSPIYRLLFPE